MLVREVCEKALVPIDIRVDGNTTLFTLLHLKKAFLPIAVTL
jgi:hypothetical protein